MRISPSWKDLAKILLDARVRESNSKARLKEAYNLLERQNLSQVAVAQDFIRGTSGKCARSRSGTLPPVARELKGRPMVGVGEVLVPDQVALGGAEGFILAPACRR